MFKRIFFLILLFLPTYQLMSMPLDELFTKGEYLMAVEQGQQGLAGAGTLSPESLQQQKRFFDYLASQIHEKPAIGFFIVQRFTSLPNCALVMSVPVAPQAHKMITTFQGAPLAVQYALCADGTFPSDNDEIKKVKQEQHAAGTKTPAEVSKLLHRQYEAALKKTNQKP